MPRHFLNTRPRDDAAPLTALLEERGHAVTAAPLLSIAYLRPDDLDLEGVAGLLATSANGLRAFAKASDRRDLAVYAVGDATARAAAEAGFSDVHSASGDVDTLAALVIERLDPETGALFHAAGTRLAGDLGGQLSAAGFTVNRCVLYRADEAKKLPQAVGDGLRSGEIDSVVFFSPRTARQFATLVRDAGLETNLDNADVFCLSAAVTEQADVLNWRKTHIADAPTQKALLNLIDANPGRTTGL